MLSVKASAKVVQKMMVAVLKARFHAERAHGPHAGDRGSELGDFDTEDFNTEDLNCTDCIETLDDDLDIGGCTLSGSS